MVCSAEWYDWEESLWLQQEKNQKLICCNHLDYCGVLNEINFQALASDKQNTTSSLCEDRFINNQIILMNKVNRLKKKRAAGFCAVGSESTAA